MKCVLAPDSFKGSLSSPQACEALAQGVTRVFPKAEIISIPLADGGEGTLEALIAATQGKTFTAPVRGPLDQAVQAHWGLLPDGKAVVELAQASGLTLVPEHKRDALRATTYGTGQLIKKALDAGCREIMVCLGGSATTDGGIGALQALGARFYDKHNVVLPPGGIGLHKLQTIDLQFLDQRLQKASLTLLCDVTNPLYGPQGAAFIYGPQKGASPQDVEFLDEGLRNLALVTSYTLKHDLSQVPGAGAAGGTAFGLLSFCKAKVRSGIETILEIVDFQSQIQGADLILTGEGALDQQTLQGKTIAGICRIARPNQIPVIGLGGTVSLNGEEMNTLGLRSAFSIVDGARSLEYCLHNAASLLETTTERVLRLSSCKSSESDLFPSSESDLFPSSSKG